MFSFFWVLNIEVKKGMHYLFWKACLQAEKINDQTSSLQSDPWFTLHACNINAAMIKSFEVPSIVLSFKSLQIFLL